MFFEILSNRRSCPKRTKTIFFAYLYTFALFFHFQPALCLNPKTNIHGWISKPLNHSSHITHCYWYVPKCDKLLGKRLQKFWFGNFSSTISWIFQNSKKAAWPGVSRTVVVANFVLSACTFAKIFIVTLSEIPICHPFPPYVKAEFLFRCYVFLTNR